MSKGQANPAQLQAIRMEGHCLILACPGAGKTFTLRERAVHLMKKYPNSRLCAVTFTADAAGELEQRIRDGMPEAGDRLICGTFHSLCKRQIEGAGRTFTLLSDGEQADLMRRAHLECFGRDGGVSLESAIAFIESMKCRVDPLTMRGDVDIRAPVYDAYQRLLSQMGAMDFSDLLLEAVRGMQDGSIPILPVQFMLVDEYQDTDPVQEAWMREHLRQGVQVTVVGDDDQSIYGWRSALSYSGLERFRLEANAPMVKLNMTYRCAREILVPAAKLIVKNEERVPKALETNSTARGVVRVRTFDSQKEEADGVIREILRSGVPHEWGILARTNAQLDVLEQLMKPHGENLPYRRSGGTSFWSLPGPALFLSVAESIVSRHMLGIDALLKKSGVGPDEMARIHTKCRSREPGALMRYIAAYGDNAKTPQAKLARLARQWVSFSDAKADLVFNGISSFITENAKLYDSHRKPEDRAKDERSVNLCADAFKGLGNSVGKCLTTMRQREQRKKDKPRSKEEAEKKREAEGARLMTLHSSKGLEFDRVWIVGCEEGVLPSKQGDKEEERRLMYVGITRAREELTLSYTVNPRFPPSSFLREAGLQ